MIIVVEMIVNTINLIWMRGVGHKRVVVVAFRRYLAEVVALVNKPNCFFATDESIAPYLVIGVDAACTRRATRKFIAILQEIQLAVCPTLWFSSQMYWLAHALLSV